MARLDNLTAYSLRCDPDLMIRVEYPGAKNLTQGLKDAIEADFSRFEKALYSYDFNDSAHGWKKYIDADSFVSYFLINELTVNYDAGAYSTYIYKDTGGKLKMCVWDFNNSCDNAAVGDEGAAFRNAEQAVVRDADEGQRLCRACHR